MIAAAAVAAMAAFASVNDKRTDDEAEEEFSRIFIPFDCIYEMKI